MKRGDAFAVEEKAADVQGEEVVEEEVAFRVGKDTQIWKRMAAAAFKIAFPSVLGAVSLLAGNTFPYLSRLWSLSSPVAVNNCSTICHAFLR